MNELKMKERFGRFIIMFRCLFIKLRVVFGCRVNTHINFMDDYVNG